MLTMSIWPLVRGLPGAYLTSNAAAGLMANASSSARGRIQLAKHVDGDNDQGDEEGEHLRHRHGGRHGPALEPGEQQQFCSPYFKSSSVPYFRDYYSRDDYANLPPGLRKHIENTGHLPPGLEKKYRLTGQLPPGLLKRFACGQTMPPDYYPYLYPVPDVAYEKVGPLPPDSKLYLYGQDLILLNDHSKAIIDILRGAY
jgi:hypothetical protein